MSNPKCSVEEKIKVAERYLCEEASAAEIAADMDMGKRGKAPVLDWAALYGEK